MSSTAFCFQEQTPKVDLTNTVFVLNFYKLEIHCSGKWGLTRLLGFYENENRTGLRKHIFTKIVWNRLVFFSKFQPAKHKNRLYNFLLGEK